jgi:hypothetical protein
MLANQISPSKTHRALSRGRSAMCMLSLEVLICKVVFVKLYPKNKAHLKGTHCYFRYGFAVWNTMYTFRVWYE